MSLFAGLVLVALIATACGGNNTNNKAVAYSTRIPPTPTQRSTPLPETTNAPEIGQGDRKIMIQLALLGDNPDSDAKQMAIQLQTALAEQVNLEFGVEFVTENEALKNLCSGAPDAAWVNVFTYGVAQTRCNVAPVLAIKRGRTPRVTIGSSVEIIGQADITAVSQLKGLVFCRSDKQDEFTRWIFPSLILASQGVNPLTDLSAVQDYPDDLSLARALYNRQCAAAALPPNQLEDLLINLSQAISTPENPIPSDSLAKMIKVIVPAGDTAAPANENNWTGFDSSVAPYEVLVFPPDSAIPPSVRSDVTKAITSFFNDPAAGSQRLTALLDATGIMAVNANDYAAFRSLITSSKWNMVFED